jgi:hypothetical protein
VSWFEEIVDTKYPCGGRTTGFLRSRARGQDRRSEFVTGADMDGYDVNEQDPHGILRYASMLRRMKSKWSAKCCVWNDRIMPRLATFMVEWLGCWMWYWLQS